MITYISHKYNVLVRLCSTSLHLDLTHHVVSEVLVLSRWRDRNVAWTASYMVRQADVVYQPHLLQETIQYTRPLVGPLKANTLCRLDLACKQHSQIIRKGGWDQVGFRAWRLFQDLYRKVASGGFPADRQEGGNLQPMASST
jgi:hypothetical protein